MRKIYIIIVLFFTLPTFSDAQNYRPLLDSINVWHYSACPVTVRHAPPNEIAAAPCLYPIYFWFSKTQYTTHDTVIDSLSYKIVEEISDQNPNNCTFGYVREDTAGRKVYFKDNLGNAEMLLYDFSMQQGDTIALNFIVPIGLYYSGTFTLDTIRTIQTNVGPSRLFCLTNHTSGFDTLYWTEGVGCMVDMFYPYSVNQQGFNFYFWQCAAYPMNSYQFLTCFDHQQKVYYDSCKYTTALNDPCFLTTDTCTYGNICGYVENSNNDFSFELFPVPATECVQIEINGSKNENVSYTITDVNGKIVSSSVSIAFTDGKATIDISQLAKGNYVITVSNENSKSSKILTIQ